VTIVTRDGVAIDSTPGGFRNTVRWTPDGRGVIVFDAKPVKEDDLIRIDVGRDGSLGVRTVLLSKVSAILRGDFDIARRSGRIVLVSGQLTIDLWTFEVNDRASARQRTNSTTWYGNPAISPDGNRLYYQRGDALGDNLYVMILPDLEEALTADRAGGLVNVHVSQDGRRVIFMQTGPTGVRLGEFDVGQRRPTYVEWGTRSGIVAPRAAGERALVYRSENGWNLMVADSLNAPGRPLLPNDSVWIGAFAPSPDGKDVAATLYTRDDAALGLISLADGKVRTLQRLDRNHSNGSVSWSDDGWIYLALTRSVDEPATLLRMRAGDTRLEEVMSLPPGCAAITSVVANRSPRGVCKRSDARGDIWLADLPSLRR
jgi:dipeptidyl aminopeptidase/acylaminoacyl peptidase